MVSTNAVNAIALAVLVVAAVAELLHALRVRRVAVLAFGPSGRPRAWTWAVPLARAAGLSLLVWGLGTLYAIDPRVTKPVASSDKIARRILIVLDVSPSMQLTDAGLGMKQTRAKRAADILMSILDRVVLEQAKVSVVAFYTGAKPVVIDAQDPNVVRNILSDLPLDQAFELGKTSLMDGIREGFELAKPWREKSTTMLLVSDGDTVPETGMPQTPPAIARVLVIGVGDPRVGKFIDGHQSRQDASTLRQVAARLGGSYHDGNEKHLPSEFLADLAESLPLREEKPAGRRELAIAATAAGGALVSLVPVALAIAGTAWRPGAGGRAGRQKLHAAGVANNVAPAAADPAPAMSGAPVPSSPTEPKGAVYA